MEQPSSSPSSPAKYAYGIRLLDCVEELVLSTLSSSLDGTLGADLGLSSDYCARLLQDADPLNVSDAFRGVPAYPLYKRLALALERCVRHGSFLRTSEPIKEIPEVDLKEECDWNDLIISSELASLYSSVEFEIHVQEPFFSQLRAGVKTVEGRCALGNYNQITPGALLLVNKHFLLRVEHVKHYSSFLEMLEAETLESVLPGVKTIEEGVKIYRKFYSEEKENSNGVLAISVSRAASQPCISMSALLSGLSYEGINCLLGMAHTVGTIPDALPPPRSALLSSFILSRGPDVSARALTKHVCRSSSGWWGNLTGNDTDKNQFSLSVIDRLLNGCSWMNTHATQSLEHVFEIRVEEGYGARWSRDGSKFIGFLEPYMEEGHGRRWRH
ncbi:unnamed protein product [Spirodela intermedia]|uniref:ASCH domain-containing protein n=1 Tax=Spirodela intermedia TaxID=51605 RepID=A0A7I8IQT5_SPIIN|nr:unnamed protein product [Spirodela intermedia]CAA6660300.1 unnamed protein product [Spirodela intermedia]